MPSIFIQIQTLTHALCWNWNLDRRTINKIIKKNYQMKRGTGKACPRGKMGSYIIFSIYIFTWKFKYHILGTFDTQNPVSVGFWGDLEKINLTPKNRNFAFLGCLKKMKFFSKIAKKWKITRFFEIGKSLKTSWSCILSCKWFTPPQSDDSA